MFTVAQAKLLTDRGRNHATVVKGNILHRSADSRTSSARNATREGT